ncbi:Hsp70 protein that interacts with Zuo1p [Actinomortierella ambigua]|uniref:Hsp70 protein that interacts with Zuo1p n=1 Tax=Actinomortierella ambigua TaxID=1343610 RepID=A0A9P6QKN0_9FUNG|nr:Hsp70 protein that interacts with Zuo1p [Actinomortierella ambigua]KAG0268431.1 Hsp70 protein that interacts with Zuo1p [Actinomortierella ambigua]
MSDSVVIGINFGVTNSSIGILGKNGHFSVIANADGDRMIPNAIGFSDEEEFCGSQAAHQVVRNPKNTLQAFRNYLGKSFTEISVPSDAAHPDMISKDGAPAYKVEFKGKEHIVTVPEAASKQLKHIHEEAEAYLGSKIAGAVLAVPVYFTDKQREELRKAATAAGINVLQIIQEPVAAALAYNFGQEVAKNDAQDKTALVLDMGATSFDITILNSRNGIYTVLETAHDVTIGGESFDQELVKFVAAEFKKKTKIDVANNKKSLLKIKTSVEITKKNLSRTPNAPCSVESVAEGMDYHATIARMRMELMCNKLYAKCNELINHVLEKAKITAGAIDEILLVGGATRMPKFQNRLRDIFPETLIRTDVESDEAIAIGCAAQASLIAGFEKEDIEASTKEAVTVTPHTVKPIGVVGSKGEFITIIPDHTPLPVKRVFEFGNAEEGQAAVYFALFEGEQDPLPVKEEKPAKPAKENDDDDSEEEEEDEIVVAKPTYHQTTQLAEVVLAGLPAGAKAGSLKIEATVQVDVTNKVTITLREKSSGKQVRAQSA